MPCDGIAVALMQAWGDEQDKQADRRQTQELARRIRAMLQENNIGYAADNLFNVDAETITLELDTRPAMNLSVGPGGTLKAMTVDGEFQVGKELLEDFVAKLQGVEKTIRLMGEVETHVHGGEGNAPWQAYAEQTGGE